MPIFREDPYGALNFLVSIGGADPQVPAAGFAEVFGLGIEIAYLEYRAGNDRTGAPRLIPGGTRYPDVTLRRGFSGSDDLFAWIRAVRDGNRDVRDVTISLLDESRAVVATWLLRDAQPKKYTAPEFSAKGNDVAIEELVLGYERLELE